MLDKIRENWRSLLVLATVIWGVVAFADAGSSISNYEYALIVGPFLIAVTIYFLFPKQTIK